MSAAVDDRSPTDPEVLRARAGTYDLLAACLDGDVDRLVEAADDGSFEGLTTAIPVDLDPPSLAEHDRRALSIGYDNLFEVPGAHYVPPFASAHAVDPATEYESDSAYHAAEDDGELLGAPAAALARYYDATGFEPTRGDGIPDHVAAVFEFLGTLAAAEADRRAAGETTAAERLHALQRRTLERLGWLDRFHERVREADGAEGTFARLVGVGRAFAAWDAQSGVETERDTAPARGGREPTADHREHDDHD